MELVSHYPELLLYFTVSASGLIDLLSAETTDSSKIIKFFRIPKFTLVIT